MHMPTADTLAALLTLTAAAAATLAADHPPRRARHLWRLPVALTGIAVADIILTIDQTRRPEPLPGTFVLASTLLLLYGGQRRAQARRRPRPPRPRPPTTTGTNREAAPAAATPCPLSPRSSPPGGEEQPGDRSPPPPSGIDSQARTAHHRYPPGGGRRLPAERPWRNGHHPAEHEYP